MRAEIKPEASGTGNDGRVADNSTELAAKDRTRS